MTRREPIIRLRSLVEKPLQKRRILRVDRNLLPQFLGIGAQKSGTTWLHSNLARIDSLFLPEAKELHYFDWNFHRPVSEYCDEFRNAGSRIRGEITPGYATLNDSRVAFIRSLVPDLRVILLLRDPIERSWSQAVMNLVEIEGGSPEEIPVEKFLEHLSEDRVRLRNDYVGIIDRWTNAFGSDQIYVGFFEDVVARPVKLLGEILDFLGVQQQEEWFFSEAAKRIRPGIKVEMPDAVRTFLVQENMANLQILADRYGAPVVDWMGRHCGEDLEGRDS